MDTIVGDITQIGKRLRVLTYLDSQEKGLPGDPLLLTGVTGSEGISEPFRFELEMHRDPHRPYIYPSNLVNTVVHFGIRTRDLPYNQEDFADYSYRTGVVEQARVKYLSQTVKSNVWVYNLVVVPAFKLLDREILFRVFENLNVRDILQEVLGNHPHISVDFSGIAAEQFPVLPYCVQFGESSYNFASRLMGQFGIWYYFDNGDIRRAPDGPTESNGRMTLGKSKPPYRACNQPDLHVKNLKDDDQLDDPETVAQCVQCAIPATQWIRAANFNQLDPTAPFSGSANIIPPLDITDVNIAPGSDVPGDRLPPEDQSNFRSELFGTPVWSDARAEDYAKTRMSGAETSVWTLNGSSKNPTLVAGFLANVIGVDGAGHDIKPPEAQTLLRHVEISAYEWGYEYSVWTNLWLPFRKVVHPLEGASGFAQFTANLASQGLSNWLQNRFPYDLQNWWHPETQLPQGPQNPAGPNQVVPYFDSFAVGGMLAAVSSLITAFESSVEQVIKSEGDDYSNSFQSIYWGEGWPRRVPLPRGAKPVAAGPHLATVISDTGVNIGAGTDVYADALGRVRVRFPWQWLVKEQMGKWSSDRSACWVRVSQGWAGAGFGWQFLPRVGEEVIVQFLDGDPDQPIIVGRVYNADHSFTNLPFPAGQDKPQTFELKDWLNPSPHRDYRFSGLKTRSQDENVRDRYHLLRLDDTCNDEQFLLRSQGRLDVTAKNSRYETTEGDRHVLVEGGKTAAGGSSFTTVGGEYDLHVRKNRYEAVDGAYQLNVKGDTQIHVGGDCKAVVDGNLSLNATTIVIEASEKITLRVGGSTVVLNPSAVWHDGPFVKKQGNGPADTAASVTIKDVTDAAKADPGEPANQRMHARSGGAGARGQHTYGPHEADGWTADYSGMVSTDLHGLSTPGGDIDVE